MGSLVFYDKKRWGWMFLMVGFACQVKYVAVLAIPFLVNRKNLSVLWIAPVAALLPYGFFYGGLIAWTHLHFLRAFTHLVKGLPLTDLFMRCCVLLSEVLLPPR